MKIITVEILGMTEVYKDPLDMPRKWHKEQLFRIAETANIRSYKKVIRTTKKKITDLPTIEDLFIKAERHENH